MVKTIEEQPILIFRTSIKEMQEMEPLAEILGKHPKIKSWNVDFDDWEKVLRIESKGNLSVAEISEILHNINIYATELLY